MAQYLSEHLSIPLE